MDTLAERHCGPCEGGTEPLSTSRAARLLAQLDGWRISEDGHAIRRDFRFRGFSGTVAFINALAWIAQGQGHHPEFRADARRCLVSFTTHAIGGLSENDFICAARLDNLVRE